jgi:uncharacterized protein YndB with AHSA1/START domain
MKTAVPALVIRRTYAVPPERVYAAWTDPVTAAQFLGPFDVRAEVPEMNVRPGGSYRVVMHHPEREDYIATGVYREVVPNRRLSMTWRWLEDDPADEHETLLTLEFAPFEGGTEFTLTHEYFASAESRENHSNGWSSILEELRTVLEPAA